MDFLLKKIEQILRYQRKWKKWQKVVASLACVVVFITTYALILPAITMDRDEAQSQGGISWEEVQEAEETVASADAQGADQDGILSAGQANLEAESDMEEEYVSDAYEENSSDNYESDTAATEEQAGTDAAGEENADEEGSLNPEEASERPAATFDEVAGDVTVHVEAPEGAFPVGTTMKVEPVADEQVMDAVQNAVEDSVTKVSAVDIIFLDASGNEIEPAAEIKVSMFSTVMENVEQPLIVHVDEEGVGETVESEQVDGAVVFESDRFSVYVIVGTETIEKTILTADGKTLTVTINYGEKAEIPEGAELEVKEIQEDDKTWGDRSARFANVLSEQYGNVTISDVRFLNISIMVNGEEFEPKAPVEVKIQYNDNIYTDNTQSVFEDPELPEPIVPDGKGHFVMAHYIGQETEWIDTEVETTEEGISESVSITPSFSEYDVAYVYEYDAPEAGTDSAIGTIGTNHNASQVSAMLAEAPMLRAAADGTPEISKDLADNHDGTYQLGLSVTGDAVTSATSSPVNVVIVYDVSKSMTGNYVPSATGAQGIQYYSSFDGVSDGEYFQLYKRVGNSYQAITDAEAYTGTVYRANYNIWGVLTGYSRYNGQRFHSSITRADAGEKVVYDFAHALFGYQDSSNPSNIQASLVTFANDASITQGWTSTENDITRMVSSTGTSHIRTYSSATNWEAAMYQAYSLVISADNDPTYVVFITDGQPTSSRQGGHYTGSDVSGSFGNTHYGRALNEARLVEQACDNKKGALYSIYAYGKAADWLASLTYYAYNGRRPTGGTEGTTFSTEGYYNASDTDALTNAINEIFSKIVDTLGVGSASIEDGTTHAVQTTSGTIAELLEVDTSSFQYWLTIPVVGSGGSYTFSMPDKATGDTVNYTATVSGENITVSWNNGANTATYKGKVNAGSLTLEWTGSTGFYNFAPPTATFTNTTGAVDWDLNSLGTLLNDVKYTVTFDVYPSQYTLDLIADLKNDSSLYDTLDVNIKKYIVKDGDDYKLATNTGATLTYKDTRIDNTERSKDFIDPDPQSTSAGKTVSVSKDWNNILDSRDKPDSLTMHVTRDGEDRYELVLNDADNWTDNAWISFGLMTIHDGTIVLKTEGHDYSFSEPADMEYYWELDVPTLRPMLINSVQTMLVKIDENEAPSMSGDNATTTSGGVTYYKLTINGKAEYYKVDNAISSLHATNNRRSYLNVVKKVDEANAPADAEFPFTMTITNSLADAGTEGDAWTDYYVWFSIYDTKAGVKVTDPGVASAAGMGYQIADDSVVWSIPSTGFNGYYAVPSGNAITLNMKAGYSLRFLNLPTGSNYSLVESSTLPDESFTLESITGNRHYKDEDGVEQDETAGTVSGTSVSGTIEYANSNYTMTFDNKYSTVDVQLKKVKEDGTTTITGSTFDLNKFGTTWSSVQTDIKPGDTETSTPNPVDLGGLGIGRYRLTETKAPDGYVILTNHVYFEVYKDTGGVLKTRLTDESGAAVTSPTDIAAIDGPGTGDTPTYKITVKNTPGAALPNTGGSGTLPYTLGGIALIMASALMYGFRMRRRERRLN